jgi:ribose/xylose/arabinose/galactoside ABC-type transport system permease subunit
MAFVLDLSVGVLATWVGSIVFLQFPGPVAPPVPDRWRKKSTPLLVPAAACDALVIGAAAGAVFARSSGSGLDWRS